MGADVCELNYVRFTIGLGTGSAVTLGAGADSLLAADAGGGARGVTDLSANTLGAGASNLWHWCANP